MCKYISCDCSAKYETSLTSLRSDELLLFQSSSSENQWTTMRATRLNVSMSREEGLNAWRNGCKSVLHKRIRRQTERQKNCLAATWFVSQTIAYFRILIPGNRVAFLGAKAYDSTSPNDTG